MRQRGAHTGRPGLPLTGSKSSGTGSQAVGPRALRAATRTPWARIGSRCGSRPLACGRPQYTHSACTGLVRGLRALGAARPCSLCPAVASRASPQSVSVTVHSQCHNACDLSRPWFGMVSERAPPGRATAVRRRRRPAGARPRGGTAPCPAAVSARPAVRLRLWSRPQAGGGQPQGPSAGGVAPESRDLRYVTANRAPCSIVGHHPYQNHLRPVCQNRSTPHQTPFRRCRHPTWAGLAPRRRRVARRVADRLATRGRGAAQAGRPRLALDGK